jgi:hypothetical protein
MIANVLTTTTGIQQSTATGISWEHELEGPLRLGSTLIAFVGGIDSQKPAATTATFSGSGIAPFPGTPLVPAAAGTGAGGSSYPCAWVFTLGAPVPSLTGTVTGTITIGFDEDVGLMMGMSTVISGVSGTFDGAPVHFAQNTQVEDGFTISGTYTTTGTNTVVVDMCMSESSNHQLHYIGTDQNKFGEILFSGPKYSLSYRDVPFPDSVGVVRSGVGGSFAGTSLTTIGLEST